MIYNNTITTPANTTEADPQETRITIEGEEIARLRIFFPFNSAGQHKIKVLHNIEQIYPRHTDEYFSGDNTVIDLPDDWQLPEKIVELKVLAWNTDDTYEHSCHIGFAVLEQSRQKPPKWLRPLLIYFPSVISKVIGVKEEEIQDGT